MEFSDKFVVKTSSEAVWDLFWDFPRLALLLPGCQKIEVVDDTHFRAQLEQRVGPFKVKFDTLLAVTEIVQGKSIVASGEGKDTMGNRLRITSVELELQPVSKEETQISYRVEFTLFGRLGTMGYPVIKRKAQGMGQEFSENIVKSLQG